MSFRQPALFISHGSPQILLEESRSRTFLSTLFQGRKTPSAIILFSAHWETKDLRVMTGEMPETLYDFGGFDPALYRLTYPAPGNSELAHRVIKIFGDAGYAVAGDSRRGFDHGAWIPLMVMFPKADIPVIQVSVPFRSSPESVFSLGELLAPLRDENILLMGSGSLTHNLYEFRGQPLNALPFSEVVEFSEWIREKAAANDGDSLLRYRELAPYAAWNHPTEEHLLPFFFAMGAGADLPGRLINQVYEYGILASDSYEWGR